MQAKKHCILKQHGGIICMIEVKISKKVNIQIRL